MLAHFKEEAEIPYPDDRPILPVEEINASMDEVEDKYANSLVAGAYAQTDIWKKKAMPILAKPDREFGGRAEKIEAVLETPLAIAAAFQKTLFGLWQEGWNLGQDHAVRELNMHLIKRRQHGKFTRAEFANPPFLAYPPDYGLPLSKTDLRSAVEQRTVKLAADVSAETQGAIYEAVLDSTEEHGINGIPPSARNKLVQKINLALGRQSAKEIRDPNVQVGDPLVRTKMEIPGTGQFRSRARQIAATELSAGYSLGRLQVYLQAGIKRVRWQTVQPSDLAICRLCRSRNGTVHDLQTVLSQERSIVGYDPQQYVIPCHPNDRCHWQPVFDDDDDDRDPNEEGRKPKNRRAVPLGVGWVGKQLVRGGLRAAAGQILGRLQKKIDAQVKEKQKQQKIRSLLARLLGAGIVGGLALGALYVLLRDFNRKWQKAGQEVRESLTEKIVGDDPESEALRQLQGRRDEQKAIAQLNLTPQQVLTQELAQKYPRLLQSGVDLRGVSDKVLRRLYGVSAKDVAQIRALMKQLTERMGAPLEKAIPPQMLLDTQAGNLLAKYPQLRDIKDLRNLTVNDIVRLGITDDPKAAIRLKQLIGNELARKMNLPLLRGVEGYDLAKIEPEELAKRLSPTLGTEKQRQAIAKKIVKYAQSRALAGDPVLSLDELQNIPGVGKKTIASMRAANLNQNPNAIAVDPRFGRETATTVLQESLGVARKVARAVVDEVRDRGGQFRDSEDMVRRVEALLQERGIEISEQTKNRLRSRSTASLSPVSLPSTQSQIVSVGVSQPLPGAAPQQQLPPATSPPQLPPAPPGGQPPSATTPPPSGGRLPTGRRTRAERKQQQAAQGSAGTTPIPVNAAEQRQNALANRVEWDVQRIGGSVQRVRQEVANRVKAQPGGLKLSKTVGESLEDADRRQQGAKVRAAEQIQQAGLAAQAGRQAVNEVERGMEELERQVEELGEGYFDKRGRRTPEASGRIEKLTKEIDTTISQIEAADAGTGKIQRTRVEPQIEELKRIRERAELVGERSLKGLEKDRDSVAGQIDGLMEEIGSLGADDVGEVYSQTRSPELLRQLEQEKQKLMDARRNLVVEEIDRKIEEMEALDLRLSDRRNAETKARLRALTDRLRQQRERLKNLPTSTKQLSPAKRAEAERKQQERFEQVIPFQKWQGQVVGINNLVGRIAAELRGFAVQFEVWEREGVPSVKAIAQSKSRLRAIAKEVRGLEKELQKIDRQVVKLELRVELRRSELLRLSREMDAVRRAISPVRGRVGELLDWLERLG